MKVRSHGLWVAVITCGLALMVIFPVFFSGAQQELAPVVDPDFLAALAAARQSNAWITQRRPHPACPNCFRVGDGYGIFEEVPGTAVVLTRDLPDPAPLRLGEVRPDLDLETGERIWDKGDQGFVGPTMEFLLTSMVHQD